MNTPPPPEVVEVDPTLLPPASYLSRARADKVYGEAFLRSFEYLFHTGIKGDILEFGTYRGYTARLLATLMAEFKNSGRLYLYDSFEGLPPVESPVDQGCYEVAVTKVWFERAMPVAADTPAAIEKALTPILGPSRLKIVKGYYEDTLPVHLPSAKAGLIHIDCDLYLSTKCVLENLLARDMFQDGCLVLFDDWNASRANPRMGERRALTEVLQNQDRFSFEPWFSYGHGHQAFFVHDRQAAQNR
jgi:hypothetical protein